MYRSEVQKILQDTAQLSAAELLRKYHSATRAEVKLACALQCLQNGEIPEACLSYLLARIRPAATELVLSENLSALEALDRFAPFSQPLTDTLLRAAVSAGVQESIIWLLKRKVQRFGFPDRDFSL